MGAARAAAARADRQRSAWPPPEAPTNLAAPPDPGTRAVAAADYVAPRPRQTRTVPKALACAVLSAVVPGLGQACQRRWRAALLFCVPVVAALAVGAWALLAHDRATLVDWGASSTVLRSLFVAGLLWALLCAISAGDAAGGLASRFGAAGREGRRRRHGPRRDGRRRCSPASPGRGRRSTRTRVLGQVFVGSGEATVAVPSPLADLGITTTVAPPTTAPRPDDGGCAEHRAPGGDLRRTTAAPTTAAPTTPRHLNRPGAGRSPCSAATPGLTAGTSAPTR